MYIYNEEKQTRQREIQNVQFGEKKRSKTFGIGAQSWEKLKVLMLDGKRGVITSGQDLTWLILERKRPDIFLWPKQQWNAYAMQFKVLAPASRRSWQLQPCNFGFRIQCDTGKALWNVQRFVKAVKSKAHGRGIFAEKSRKAIV